MCETKESVVTFVSRWCGTKPLTSGDVLAAAKSSLWLLIADQSLITLINGRGFWGPGLWGLLSVSVQLKRSRRRPKERASPVGAISGLTADTSQMDPVASEQDSVFGERYPLRTDQKKPLLRGEGGQLFLLFSEHIFYPLFLSSTRPLPKLYRRNSQWQSRHSTFFHRRWGVLFSGLSLWNYLWYFHFPAAVKWLKDTDHTVWK